MGRWTLRIGLGAAALAVAWALAPDVDALSRILDQLQAAGPWGAVLFGIGYTVLSLVMVPGSWVQGAAGLLYGPVAGFAFASVASLVSAALGFAIARTLGRTALRERFDEDGRLAALDRAVGAGGLAVVIASRLSPISPFNIVNYLYGLTSVRTRDYLLGTWIGSIPPILLYSQVGASAASLPALLDGTAAPGPWRWLGLAATVIASVVVAIYARRFLAAAGGVPEAQAVQLNA